MCLRINIENLGDADGKKILHYIYFNLLYLLYYTLLYLHKIFIVDI